MPTANSGSRVARHASNTSSKSSYKKRHNRRKEKTACFKNLSWLTYRWDGRFLARRWSFGSMHDKPQN